MLTIGGEYQVESVDMGQSYTNVWLVGINRGFNSVLFDFYDNGKEVDLRDYPEFNPYLSIKNITKNKGPHIAVPYGQIATPSFSAISSIDIPALLAALMIAFI